MNPKRALMRFLFGLNLKARDLVRVNATLLHWLNRR
jgi:hypothetical protein